MESIFIKKKTYKVPKEVKNYIEELVAEIATYKSVNKRISSDIESVLDNHNVEINKIYSLINQLRK